MVERALLVALVALAVAGAASAVSTAFTKMAERTNCAFSQANVCVIDGDAR